MGTSESMPGRGLSGAVRGELAHEVDVLAVDQERAGQSGFATAQDVAVDLVQRERVDRLVPLQIRLLVARPLQVTRPYLRRDLRAEGERAALRLSAGVFACVA